MEKEVFIKRLIELRLKKDVSAREMSLSLGMGENYINTLENGDSLPNMTTFLLICDYFGITPKEFFDDDVTPHNKKLYDLIMRLPDKYVRSLIPFFETLISDM